MVHEIRRRTVLTGAVWSAPVVALAVAAPAAAASQTASIVTYLEEIDANEYALNVFTYSAPGTPIGNIPLTIEQNLGEDGAINWQMYDYVTTGPSGALRYRSFYNVLPNQYRITGTINGQFLIANIAL